MARRILHVIWIGLFWHSCTWQTPLAARSVAPTGSTDRRNSKNGRPILAMANSPRCIYNGKPVEDGRQVSSPEPCLNCTCNKGVLLCYLHSCMPVVVPSPECYVARVKGHCCPEVFCKVSTAPPSPSGAAADVGLLEIPVRRSDDISTSKKRTTPSDMESIGILPVLLKRNHNKASSVAQTTETPVLETSSVKSTPPFFQSNHRPGGTVRDRPHFKRRSTTAVSTRSSPSPAISRKTPPPRVTVTKEPPEEEEPEKIVYDLRLGASQNSTKPDVNNLSSNDTASCYINGYEYLEGMAMLSSSKCEYCYCIRGHQMCVRPKCHLKIDGCEARYHSGFTCCPSHYYCEPEVNKSSAALIDSHSSKLKPTRPTVFAIHKGNGCLVDGHIFSLGVAVPSRGHCQTCYCTQVGVVCRRLECAPRVDGCEPVVPEGHCCPREYTCGVRGSNASEGLVSHSTDNYDVTVFSAQSSGKIPSKNQPNLEGGTTTPSEGNSTTIENAKDGQKVTIHLKGSSHLEKVSILPNENLAILVVTTEETKGQGSKEQPEVTRFPELPSKKSRPSSTSSIPTTTTQIFDLTPSVKGARISDATSGVETSSVTTASGIKGKVTSQSILSVPTTQAGIEQVTIKVDSPHSTSGSATNGSNDYYYDDEYDYSDYFYEYRRPPQGVKVPNRPHITQTFAPFPENDGTSFGDRINQKNRQPNATTNIYDISIPNTPEVNSLEQTTSNQTSSQFTTREPWSSIKRPQIIAQKPSKVNQNNQKQASTSTSVVQTTIRGQQEIHEVTIPSGVSEFSTDPRDRVFSQGLHHPSASVTSDLNDSSSTTKRQSPPILPQFTADIVPDRLHTTSSGDYRNTDGSTVYLSNQKTVTTDDTQSSQTRDVLFEIPTRSRRPILTKAPGVKRPQVTMSFPVSSGIITTSEYLGKRTPPSSSGIKTINNVLPQGIAEVLLSLTESTPQNYEQETSSFKDFTSTTQEEIGTVSPIDDLEMLASPKLIVQSSLVMKDGQSVVQATTRIPVINNHDPPHIVFSNHRPSLNKRPPPPILTNRPFTTVNNHKNYQTSFSIPVRQKTTTEPLLEFSNHKPVTMPPFRPQFPVETRKPGFFRPTGDANKNRFSPFKVHRVIPEATNLENSPNETDESEEKGTKEVIFGLRTNNRYFSEQTPTVGNRVTATLRWNDASTNPVTVGFDVKPNIYGMEPETKEGVDDQFELSESAVHSESNNYEPEVSSLSPVAVEITTAGNSLMQSNHSGLGTSVSEKDPPVTEATGTTTVTAQTTTNSLPRDTASVETESTKASSKQNTPLELPVDASVKPTSETENSQPPLEFRNKISVSKENIDHIEEKDQSSTERPTKATSYKEYSTPTTLTQDQDFIEKTDIDRNRDSQAQHSHHVKGAAAVDHKQSSKLESGQHSEVLQDVNSAGNETKLYRAEENNKQGTSSFIDRLIPYGSGHEQRLPHPPVRLHAVLPERKTTTPAPQVTSAVDEKEIGDVCFVDGRFYKSGEIIVKENPCEICRCFYGHPLCQIQQCPPPPGPACILEYLSGYCCPRVTCGVKLDGLRPPGEGNSIFSVPNDVRPPSITMDNQWKPVESPRPVPPRNATSNGNQAIDGYGSLTKDESDAEDSRETLETASKMDLSPETSGSSKDNFKESSTAKRGDAESNNFIATTPSSQAGSQFQPNPVFDPNSLKKPGSEKKDSKDQAAIHDNSSGVRKILNEAVTLPPSKMSVPPPAPAEVNPVLPFFHVRTPMSKNLVNHTTTSPPPLDFIIGEGIENLPAELGGNLKLSGCNVYGKYYKINDKVSALSQPCSECVCSSEGITCHSIC